jgi:hypothetical protein
MSSGNTQTSNMAFSPKAMPARRRQVLDAAEWRIMACGGPAITWKCLYPLNGFRVVLA